jgi:hypothetical protein
MNTKPLACWEVDPNAHIGRVRVSSDLSLLLPHGDLALAKLKTEGKERQFRLVFVAHEVLVSGHCLRRAESAMQRLELSFMAKLATRAGREIGCGSADSPIAEWSGDFRNAIRERQLRVSVRL